MRTIHRRLSALMALILALGLTLMAGGGGVVLAQDPVPTVRPGAIEAINTQLIGQVDTGKSIDGTLTVDGQPFVLADGSIRRVGPNGLEPGVSLQPIAALSGIQDGTSNTWTIINAWPAKGGTTFYAKIENIDGEIIGDPLPGVLLADGSVHFLVGGPGNDRAIVRLTPDGGLSTTSLSAIIPANHPVAIEYGPLGAIYLEWEDIPGESRPVTGWFDHIGNFNVVSVIEFQDGDDLFLRKIDPTGANADNLVINLSVGWDPSVVVPVVPHGDGGLTIIATELDAGNKAFSFDPAGNLVAERDLPGNHLDGSSPLIQQAILTESYPIFITPAGRAADGWQLISMDPAQPTPVNIVNLPADFVPRPDMFAATGRDGQAYLAVQNADGELALMALNTRNGGGGVFNNGGPLIYDLIGTVGPDNNLYLNSGNGFLQVTPDGKATPILTGTSVAAATVAGFSFGVERELYVIDRNGTISIFGQ